MDNDRAENLEETCICVWGDNTFGQLALDTPSEEQQLFMPKHITFEIHINEISCAFQHTLLRTVEGKLYASGNNLKGQLGIGKKIKRKTSPTMLPLPDDDEKVLIADAQGYHNIIYTEYGNVYVWGDNSYGQLGTEDFEDHDVPFDITNNLKLGEDVAVKGISCGREHSAILLTNGRAMAWGSNANYQLGVDTNSRDEISTPTMCSVSNIKQVAAGYDQTLWLDTQGDVWVVGNNSDSRLIASDNNRYIKRPTKIQAPERVKRVAASNFNALVSEKDVLYIWGNFLDEILPICAPFDEDEIGSVRSNPQKESSQLSSKYIRDKSQHRIRVASIGLGHNLVVISDDTGDCYSWGLNDNGQLGQVLDENQSDIASVEPLPKKLTIFRPFETKSVHVGYNFAMILVVERSPEDMEANSIEYAPFNMQYNNGEYSQGANPNYKPEAIHQEEEDEDESQDEQTNNEQDNQDEEQEEESVKADKKGNGKMSEEMFEVFRLIVFLYENLRFNLIKIIDDNVEVDDTLSEEFINLIRKQQDIIDDYLQRFNLRIDLPIELNLTNLYKFKYPNALKLVKDELTTEEQALITQEQINQQKEEERKILRGEIVSKLKEERGKIDKRISQLSEILKDVNK